MTSYFQLVTVVLVIGLTSTSTMTMTTTTKKIPCKNHEWTCWNDECIPRYQWCNQKSDCFDRSDERDCPPYEVFPAACQDGIIKGDHCYFMTFKMNYSQALAYCHERTAILAGGEGYKNCWEVFSVTLGVPGPIWLGLHDGGTKGQHWYWEDSKKKVNIEAMRNFLTITCWRDNLWPQITRQKNCGAFISNYSSGGVRPYGCEEKHIGLCQLKKGCPEGTVRCRGTRQCIKASWFCDGHEDCSDESDEDHCASTHKPVKATTTTTPPTTTHANSTDNNRTTWTLAGFTASTVFSVLILAACLYATERNKTKTDEMDEINDISESESQRPRSKPNPKPNPNTEVDLDGVDKGLTKSKRHKQSMNSEFIAHDFDDDVDDGPDGMALLEQEFQRLAGGSKASSDSDKSGRKDKDSDKSGRKDKDSDKSGGKDKDSNILETMNISRGLSALGSMYDRLTKPGSVDSGKFSSKSFKDYA